jgi:hypothetical protein
MELALNADYARDREITMPAYNFQARFASMVESGLKRQTIRAIGKRRHACPGDSLQLYTGQRTKQCRKLVSPDPVCVAVQSVYIYKVVQRRHDNAVYQMYIDGKFVFQHEAAVIAEADGFEDKSDFFTFFEEAHGMPFHGVMIQW